MYLGARATGMSGQRALAWAGQGYINRIDAQQGKYEKAAASGNYTKESLQAYKESGDPIDLLPKGVAPVELGQSKEFYGPKGNRINARQVQVGDNKVWVDKNNKPINLNSVHEDPTRAPELLSTERVYKMRPRVMVMSSRVCKIGLVSSRAMTVMSMPLT